MAWVAGLAAADWLAEQGAGCIVLVGRRRPMPPSRSGSTDCRRGIGARSTARWPMSATQEPSRAWSSGFGREWPPLRGIIHAAGVLDDGVLTEQRWERFENVLKPKAMGAWVLHQLSKDLPLDFFVLYSSVASVLGSAGQSTCRWPMRSWTAWPSTDVRAGWRRRVSTGALGRAGAWRPSAPFRRAAFSGGGRIEG